jgi:hypothetical protein
MDGQGGSAARPRLRIGDAERERLLAVLKEHYAAGRLTLDEIRERTEVVLSARYADEADVVLADLPGTATPPYPAVPGKAPAAAQRRRGLLARRGHAEREQPDPGWVRTSERFRDPSSGTVMRVWTDPADGSRHYVPDDPTA